MSPAAVAVTGAGGYLGSRLCADLAGSGVRALTRAPVPFLGDVEQVAVDLLAPVDQVAEALRGVDAVVHLAGHNEVVAAADPDRAITETIVMARHAAEAAARAGVGRVVYVSTVHVYGTRLDAGATVDEDVAPSPRSPYAVARLAAEHLLAGAGDPVVLRLTNAVGAPVHADVNRWTLVAADLCRSAAATGELVLRSSGLQWRDFISLGDVTRIVAAATDPARVPPGTYNVASGVPTTVRALAELVQDRIEARTGQRPVLRAPDPDGTEPGPYRVDPGRLDALGLRAEQPLADAVDELVDLCFAPTPTGAATRARSRAWWSRRGAASPTSGAPSSTCCGRTARSSSGSARSTSRWCTRARSRPGTSTTR